MCPDTPTFQVVVSDDSTLARTGLLATRRGVVHTPGFMPVGTQATVKALDPREVRETGAEIVLANTYHLMLRPGIDVITAAGGLHRFMAWDGPILTDSGGFQIYSLAHRRKVEEAGVTFRSHIDGSSHVLTPELAVDLQLGFQSDVIMPLDDVVGYEVDARRQRDAVERTHRWLARAVARFHQETAGLPGSRPLLFGITQGGFDAANRRSSARAVAASGVDGFAIGGLSVGEPKDVMAAMLAASIEPLPSERVRYLMGVGSPEDLWRGVAAGVDLFDCVHPTRIARRGALFTPEGRINLRNARFRSCFDPPDPTCDCSTCRTFSAAYLHHLFHARELLAYRLASIHNLRFMQRQMEAIRASIVNGRFETEMREFLSRYRTADLAAAERERRSLLARRSGDTGLAGIGS